MFSLSWLVSNLYKGLVIHRYMFNYRNTKPSKLPKFMTTKEVRRFFKAFKLNTYNDIYHYYLFKTMYYTGARISEALNIRLENIRFEERTIKIEETKNGTEHILLLPSTFNLKKWITTLKKFFPNTPYLFPAFYCKSSSLTARERYFKKILKEADLPSYFHPHSLRHSFAVNLLNSGTDVRKVAQLLNHKDLSATMVYTYCATQHLVEEVEKLPVV